MPSPDLVRESQCRRHGDGLLIDAVVAADARRRSLQKALEGARTQQRSHGSLRRGKPPSAGDDAAAAILTRDDLEALASTVAAAQAMLQALLQCISNLVHEHAPFAPPTPAPARALTLPARPIPSEPAGAALLWQRLHAVGLAEPTGGGGGGGGGSWQACGLGLLLEHAWLTHALGVLGAHGFELSTEPLQPTADTLAKLDKLRANRGERLPGGGAAAFTAAHSSAALASADPLSTAHACSTRAPSTLPLRHASVRRTAHGTAELWARAMCADDGSCWDVLNELLSLATALHAELLLGVPLRIVERHASELGRCESRAFALVATGGGDGGGGGGGVELARGGCEYDFRARRLGVRCCFPQLGESGKRHVHMVTACLCAPTACAVALASAPPPHSVDP